MQVILINNLISSQTIYSSRFSKVKKWYVKIWCGVWLSLWEIWVSRSSQRTENTRKVSPSASPLRVGLPQRYQPSLKLCQANIWLSLSPPMFAVNIQPGVRSELLDRVLKRGESLWSVTVISLLIFNLNSLQFGCNTEPECAQPRTPQSNSSVWEKTESSSM